MNERIRELAQEAYDYALIHDNSMHGEVYNKKFAELIVKECLEQIDDGNSDHAGGNADAINRIKEHFGVE